ncbi:MAG: CinA family protein [Chloroflexota bacterium]|nr:CinA family protein [Chloroflexota bacterium]
MNQDLYQLSSQIGEVLTRNSFSIATAESCTGGLLAHILTSVSGSSNYFVGSVVSYSNQIKEQLLGVQPETLEHHGAVSSQTAQEMAVGIREKFCTDIGLSTTGIAGPTGGTSTKPVGLVWIGLSTKGKTTTIKCQFVGDREQVKTSSVQKILQALLSDLKG